MTVKLQLTVLADGSLTDTVTACSPSENSAPDCSELAIDGLPELSLASGKGHETATEISIGVHTRSLVDVGTATSCSKTEHEVRCCLQKLSPCGVAVWNIPDGQEDTLRRREGGHSTDEVDVKASALSTQVPLATSAPSQVQDENLSPKQSICAHSAALIGPA